MSIGDSPASDLPVVGSVPCRHLRSKGMYVYSDYSLDEGQQDYDNTLFWCLKSMKNFGPDDGFVDREGCTDPSRECHEAI